MFQRSFEHHPQGMGENKNEVGLTLRKQGEKVRVSSTFTPLHSHSLMMMFKTLDIVNIPQLVLVYYVLKYLTT